ncbi:PIG-L family deacetylase [Craterilacuibacter sp. RT1T]|uniref:PIG-L deacetylase family protein n=1 Tax=Craterilacuibacter sp. RT1T TaxID=2942211 RepID=UPI0020BFF89C|nr:PIG-L family deacetylase [Craterilacuibacter sp. RT1T]MCL6262753.1 PIG-L family deacetylase [Craterilacuibacter sp. RT1T]
MENSKFFTFVTEKNPNFSLGDDGYLKDFFSRPEAKLNADETKVWHSIDGFISNRDIEIRHPSALKHLVKFHDKGWCEFIEPHFPIARKSVLVVEPHMDDAAFSVGGLMLARRNECRFTILSMTGVSNYTEGMGFSTPMLFPTTTVSRLRNAESALMARMIGGEHLSFSMPDAPLRYADLNKNSSWSIEWFIQHSLAIEAFIKHRASLDERCIIEKLIADFIEKNKYEEVWLPMGLGWHSDHELTRDAWLNMLGQCAILNSSNVYLYNDVPYINEYPLHCEQIIDAFNKHDGCLHSVEYEISSAMEEKKRIVGIYRSQFSPLDILPRVEYAARSKSSSFYQETLHRIVRMPSKINFLNFYSRAQNVKLLEGNAEKILTKYHKSKRVRLFVGMPFGRTSEDLLLILQAFPDANVEVRVASNAWDEVKDYVHPRIFLGKVSSKLNFASLLFAALLSPWKGPVLVIVGERARRIMNAICRRKVFNDSHFIAADTASDLATVLLGRQERGER